MNAYPERQRPPDPGPGLPAMLYVLAAFALFCLPALPVWVVGAALVRLTRVRLWHLAVAALALGAGVVLLEGGPTEALARHFAGYALLVRQVGAKHPAPAARVDLPAPATPGRPDRAGRGRLPRRRQPGHRHRPGRVRAR